MTKLPTAQKQTEKTQQREPQMSSWDPYRRIWVLWHWGRRIPREPQDSVRSVWPPCSQAQAHHPPHSCPEHKPKTQLTEFRLKASLHLCDQSASVKPARDRRFFCNKTFQFGTTSLQGHSEWKTVGFRSEITWEPRVCCWLSWLWNLP